MKAVPRRRACASTVTSPLHYRYTSQGGGPPAPPTFTLPLRYRYITVTPPKAKDLRPHPLTGIGTCARNSARFPQKTCAKTCQKTCAKTWLWLRTSISSAAPCSNAKKPAGITRPGQAPPYWLRSVRQPKPGAHVYPRAEARSAPVWHAAFVDPPTCQHAHSPTCSGCVYIY